MEQYDFYSNWNSRIKSGGSVNWLKTSVLDTQQPESRGMTWMLTRVRTYGARVHTSRARTLTWRARKHTQSSVLPFFVVCVCVCGNVWSPFIIEGLLYARRAHSHPLSNVSSSYRSTINPDTQGRVSACECVWHTETGMQSWCVCVRA